jgi:hypothetical protein
MAAGRYNFVIEQGTTFELELQYKDSNNNAIDLTGYSGKMQLRPFVGATASYLCLSSSRQPDGTGLNFNGLYGTYPVTSGSIGVYISAATSSALTFSEAVYDLEIYSGSFVSRLLQGKVQLSREVTLETC